MLSVDCVIEAVNLLQQQQVCEKQDSESNDTCISVQLSHGILCCPSGSGSNRSPTGTSGNQLLHTHRAVRSRVVTLTCRGWGKQRVVGGCAGGWRLHVLIFCNIWGSTPMPSIDVKSDVKIEATFDVKFHVNPQLDFDNTFKMNACILKIVAFVFAALAPWSKHPRAGFAGAPKFEVT